VNIGGGALSCDLSTLEVGHVRGKGSVSFPARFFLPAREVLSIYRIDRDPSSDGSIGTPTSAGIE
jgi:hypothetical protein